MEQNVVLITIHTKEAKPFLGVMDVFIILSVLIISQVEHMSIVIKVYTVNRDVYLLPIIPLLIKLQRNIPVCLGQSNQGGKRLSDQGKE